MYPCCPALLSEASKHMDVGFLSPPRTRLEGVKMISTFKQSYFHFHKQDRTKEHSLFSLLTWMGLRFCLRIPEFLFGSNPIYYENLPPNPKCPFRDLPIHAIVWYIVFLAKTAKLNFILECRATPNHKMNNGLCYDTTFLRTSFT